MNLSTLSSSVLPTGCARSTHQQLSLEDNLTRGASRISHALNKEFSRCFAYFIGWLGNEGDGRLHERSPGGFVKGNESDVIRNGEVAFSDGLQGTCREQAVRGEKCIRPLCGIKHSQCSRVTCLYFWLNVLHKFCCWREVVHA